MRKLFYLFFLLMCTACSNYLADDETESELSSEKSVPMRLKVRSSSPDDIHYPIAVFVFNHSGKLINQSEITSSETPFTLELAPGEYQLSAFSGLNENDYVLPKEITASSIIQQTEKSLCKSAIQYGHSIFSLEKKMDLSIQLAYIVSSLEFKFTNIPQDATSVEVGITPVSSGFSFNGNYTNDEKTYRTPCKLVDSTWVAGPIYTLPSHSSHTNLSINVDRPSGSETLSYNYSSQLGAAQPYCFSGNYHGNISLSGTFEIGGWKPGIDVNFDFSEEGTTDPEIEDPEVVPEDNGVITASSLPEAGSFWNDFYVWKAEKSANNETKAILLSPKQWFKILANDGPGLLDEYEINGFSDWRVFTKDEAREFFQEFSSDMPALNAKLSSHDQDEFYFYNSERYLCDDCKSTFNLYGKQTIREAGKKTEYYMRALKDVKVVLKK